MFFGPLGDRFGARRTFGVCLILAGISMLTFGNWSSFSVLVVLLFLNGAFQSLCWPSANKGLAAWVSDSQRSTIFGYFGTCPFVGGILGTAFAVHLLNTYGWRYVHIYPALFCVGSNHNFLSLSLFFNCDRNEQNAISIFVLSVL